jgi:tRNA nucleotidyltransferase (CCA-adding enzyme)
VEGDVITLAEAIAAATGGRLLASHAPFGTATVEAPGQAGAPPLLIDLARARVERYEHPAALPLVTPATIAEDLVRRDFSVNAMACELSLVAGALRVGPLLDPFGGQGDLAAGRLRLLHAASLRDDPTRMLRGLRLAARLGMDLAPDAHAQLAAALAAGYLALLSPERVLAELCLALREQRPDEALRRADAWGVTAQILPGLAWSETLAARSARLAAAEPPAEAPLVWAGLLLYDLAPEELARLAARYPLPSHAATLLHQLTPLRALAPGLGALSPSALDRALRPFSVTACAVLQYAEPSAAAPTARYLRELRPARPPLDGNDLRRLGVAPGPALGQLLAELRAAALDGAITTRAQAEAWVRARLA